MSVDTLPYPREFADGLEGRLSSSIGGGPRVHATPFDADHNECAAYRAHHYEITASYANTGAPIDELEQAVAHLPGVYITTQWHPYRDPDITNPDWPERRVKHLRRAERLGDNGAFVRPRVFALIADPDEAESS